MKYRREFEIPYIGLKEGITELSFEIGEPFFEMLEIEDHSADFESVNATVDLKIDKHPNFFDMTFSVNGDAVVPCDRCGDTFPLTLWDEFKLIVKLVDQVPEEDNFDMEDEADIVFWPKSEPIIDVSEWIYEFILLSLPIQKIHPDDAEGNSTCNKDSLALLQMMQERAEANARQNSVWKGLDALKNKNNNN